MSYQHLLMTRSDHICTLTVNRPSSLNSLTPQAIDELIHAVNVLETDQDTKSRDYDRQWKQGFCRRW